MGDTRIEVFDTGIRIVDVDVPSKDAADFLQRVDEPKREAALVQAIEVGIFCLERARTSQDLDFVKRQVESLISTVRTAVEKIPEETQKSLSAMIGTERVDSLAREVRGRELRPKP